MPFAPIKTLLLSIIACALTASGLYGQNKLPYDSVMGKIAYNFTVEIDKPYKKEAMYRLIQEWLNQPEVFNRSNVAATAAPTAEKAKSPNKEAVEREFANLTPLQSLDPESDRQSGKGIIKYAGNANGCIRLMYIQYAVIVIIEDNKLMCEVGYFKYNHFNPRNYQSMPVFNWSGLMPCDNVNTMEYLIGCEACHTEFST
ncbi:MAG TPA: hypothetical protein VK154_09485, partial [Chitinophagales bacterium]|nr:hypothetical protein [Chitinophagales bacterium]